jgi:S1-C subfamily serine protease
VLRADEAGLAPLPIVADADARVGQLVLAIGNPLRFERSVSLGVVSAIDRALPGRDGGLEGLIQTDAAINPGNSGGPLVDTEGRVVGINTAIIPFAQGIGFAIPSATANWVAAVLIQRGAVQRPRLGIAAAGEELAIRIAQSTGQPRALRVLRVEDPSPARTGGLRDGDLVLAADGKKITRVDELQRTMVLSQSRELLLEVWRKGQKRSVSIRPQRGKAA